MIIILLSSLFLAEWPNVQSVVPQIVAISPASGSIVEPGDLTLRVTFDRPMRAESYSFVAIDDAAFPACAGRPMQSEDKRTFVLRCSIQPAQRYAVGFNSGRFRNFVSDDSGVPAAAATVVFSTP